MNGYGIKCEHLFYTFLKKHYCPNCGNKLLRKRISAVINSESPEVKDYDFEVVDITVKDDIKFTHIEFYCKIKPTHNFCVGFILLTYTRKIIKRKLELAGIL